MLLLQLLAGHQVRRAGGRPNSGLLIVVRSLLAGVVHWACVVKLTRVVWLADWKVLVAVRVYLRLLRLLVAAHLVVLV